MSPKRIQPLSPQIISPAQFKFPTRANEIRLYQDVCELAKYLRNPEHMDELNLAADYIKHEWEKLDLKVEEEKFTIGEKEFRNLKVRLGPASGELFVIGAHYDVYGDQPGADDNASGVSGMLELTRLIIENNINLKAPLELVAFTLEEPPYGCLGSHVYKSNLGINESKVKGMLALEMIGYFSDEPHSQKFPLKPMNLVYGNKGNFISVVGYGGGRNNFNFIKNVQQALINDGQISARKLWLPVNAFGLDRSDHCHFVSEKFSAGNGKSAMVTDTAEYRNRNYHSKKDEPNTLNYVRMAQVVQGIYGFLRELQ